MPVRRAMVGFAVAAAVLASSVFAGAGPAATERAARVTFVGDSVPASISYTPQARSILSRGFAVRLDLRVCRRLLTASCPYQGSTPPNALEAVRSLGRSLGDVLIVNVGYNESSAGYQRGIDQIMRAALSQGAAGEPSRVSRGPV